MSLADLQAERDKLRAINAKADFDEMLAATCDQRNLVAAARAVRATMLDAIDALTGRFLEAARGEHDETRVHYLLSDAAHDALSEMGEAAERVSTELPELGAGIRRGAKPRDLLTVSQWADRHRWLKSGTNAPGRWHTSLTPYLREIMDALSEHSPVRTVAFIKSSGVGGTEAMYNWIGYCMHHLENKDMLVVVPTLELRDRSFNPRLAKMLDETEALTGLVTNASRNRANRGDLIEYGARARIIKAGANSPDSLRSDHLPYVICDEVDAFPWDVGGEGDPMTLIENRQRTFSRAKTFCVSTPTLEHTSRINILYARSDRRRYHVPCPHCGEFQPLEWGGKDARHGLKWRVALPDAETGETEHIAQVIDAWYVCAKCFERIDEHEKTGMLNQGVWIAQRPNMKAHRGYHINALYAPVGLGLGWRAVAQKWLNSQNDTAELKGFVNTYLGEVWSEQGDSIEPAGLLTRLEDYTPDSRPFGLISAGVDVQKDRIEASIVGWAAAEECWLLDHIILPGDTAQPQVWADLHDALTEAGVEIAAIDTGYNTGMAYAFCEKRKWAIPIKGQGGGGRPFVEPEKTRRARLRLRRKKGVSVEPLGVDNGKALLYARLKLPNPGAGYVHFPRTPAFDEEYFAQLGAEKLVTKVRGTRPFLEWVQTRPRNEALDCLVYALAAMRLSGRDLEREIIRKLDGAPPPLAAPSPAPPPPIQRSRHDELMVRLRERRK